MQLSGVRSSRGVLARCPGLTLTPRVQSIKWPRGKVKAGKPAFRLRCSIDCAYTATVVTTKLKPVVTFRGRLVAGKLKLTYVRKPLPPGSYRLQLALVAPLNPGKPVSLRGPVFSIAKAR